MNREKAFEFIAKELDHQNAKWGRGDGEWESSALRKLAVIAEEFGEIAMALNDGDALEIREELIDCAASCIAFLMSDFNVAGEPNRQLLQDLSLGSKNA